MGRLLLRGVVTRLHEGSDLGGAVDDQEAGAVRGLMVATCGGGAAADGLRASSRRGYLGSTKVLPNPLSPNPSPV